MQKMGWVEVCGGECCGWGRGVSEKKERKAKDNAETQRTQRFTEKSRNTKERRSVWKKSATRV
jgi:hypothetical protein